MKKILISDDSLFMRNVLKDILSGKGREYEIIEADSGATTLEQFEREKPDLVLQDIIMPEGEKEGIRLLETIMKTKPATKVIMITAIGQDLVMEECRKLGCKDYITKPFDEERVQMTVAKWIGD